MRKRSNNNTLYSWYVADAMKNEKPPTLKSTGLLILAFFTALIIGMAAHNILIGTILFFPIAAILYYIFKIE